MKKHKKKEKLTKRDLLDERDKLKELLQNAVYAYNSLLAEHTQRKGSRWCPQHIITTLGAAAKEGVLHPRGIAQISELFSYPDPKCRIRGCEGENQCH